MPSFRQKISCEIYTVGLDMVGIGRYDLLESSRAEQSRAEQSRAEQSRAEPSRAEPSRAEPKILASSSPPFAVFVRLIIL